MRAHKLRMMKGKIMDKKAMNQKAMNYLQNQVDCFKGEKSSYLNGVIHGACQALCMAGIINDNQWKQIEDQMETK